MQEGVRSLRTPQTNPPPPHRSHVGGPPPAGLRSSGHARSLAVDAAGQHAASETQTLPRRLPKRANHSERSYAPPHFRTQRNQGHACMTEDSRCVCNAGRCGLTAWPRFHPFLWLRVAVTAVADLVPAPAGDAPPSYGNPC